MATIKRLDHNVYEIRYEAGRDAAGRRQRKSVTLHGPRSAAVNKAKLLEARRMANRTGHTFGDALATWTVTGGRRQTDSRSTEEVERRAKLYFHQPVGEGFKALGEMHPEDITVKVLEQFYARVRALGRSEGFIRHLHWDISGTLRMLVRHGELDANVAERVELPPLRRREVEPPDIEDLALLLRTADELAADSFPMTELALAMRLAIATGARLGELCALTWGDLFLDSDPPFVRVNKSVTEVANDVRVKGIKTAKGGRMVPVPESLSVTLRAHLQAVTARIGTSVGSDCYVLLSPRSATYEPIPPSALKGRFARLKEKAGVGCRFHDLRHYAVSVWLAHGLTLHEAASLAGHARASTTSDIYGHLLKPVTSKAAKAIEATGIELRSEAGRGRTAPGGAGAG
jgi:integrase